MINNKSILCYDNGASTKAPLSFFDPESSNIEDSNIKNKKLNFEECIDEDIKKSKNFISTGNTVVDKILDEKEKRNAKSKTNRTKRKIIKKSRKSNRK